MCAYGDEVKFIAATYTHTQEPTIILFPAAAENERASNIVRLPPEGPHFIDSSIKSSSSLECYVQSEKFPETFLNKWSIATFPAAPVSGWAERSIKFF